LRGQKEKSSFSRKPRQAITKFQIQKSQTKILESHQPLNLKVSVNEIVNSWFAFLCASGKARRKSRTPPVYIGMPSAIGMSQISKAATEVAGNRTLTQTDTAARGTPGATSLAAVSGLNRRIESPLSNNSLFSEVVSARGPAYSNFNSSPRT
jgi:hypothetical protein